MEANTLNTWIDACTNFSPTWCEVDTVLRLRATLTTGLGNGMVTPSPGAAAIRGRAKAGGEDYVDATGQGLSLGVA